MEAPGCCCIPSLNSEEPKKYAWSLFLQHFLPMPNLGRMYAKLLGDFVYRLNSSDRINRDLGFKLTAEILAIFFARYLLLFIAGYHLILLSGIWGPL